jgi:DNA ligase-1
MLKSIKLDGHRAYWDGTNLWSKSLTKCIRAPQWFTDLLPKNLKLDGELYAGEKSFEIVQSIVKHAGVVHPEEEQQWAYLMFMVIDVDLDNKQLTKMERYEILQNDSRFKNNPVMMIIPQTPLWYGSLQANKHENIQELTTAFQYVIANKGKGLILVHADSKYKDKHAMIKIKQVYETDDAIVTKIYNNKHTSERTVMVDMKYMKKHVFENVRMLHCNQYVRVGDRVRVRWSDWIHHLELDRIYPRFPVVVIVVK